MHSRSVCSGNKGTGTMRRISHDLTRPQAATLQVFIFLQQWLWMADSISKCAIWLFEWKTVHFCAALELEVIISPQTNLIDFPLYLCLRMSDCFVANQCVVSYPALFCCKHVWFVHLLRYQVEQGRPQGLGGLKQEMCGPKLHTAEFMHRLWCNRDITVCVDFMLGGKV